MELQTFVEQAIANGVEAARKPAPSVAPRLEQPREDDGVTGVTFTRDRGNLQPVFLVEFDPRLFVG